MKNKQWVAAVFYVNTSGKNKTEEIIIRYGGKVGTPELKEHRDSTQRATETSLQLQFHFSYFEKVCWKRGNRTHETVTLYGVYMTGTISGRSDSV